MNDGRDLVAEVRDAAQRHGSAWDALVPDRFHVDLRHEAAEDAAFAEMASAKAKLRAHICETYGLTVRELSSLATV